MGGRGSRSKGGGKGGGGASINSPPPDSNFDFERISQGVKTVASFIRGREFTVVLKETEITNGIQSVRIVGSYTGGRNQIKNFDASAAFPNAERSKTVVGASYSITIKSNSDSQILRY